MYSVYEVTVQGEHTHESAPPLPSRRSATTLAGREQRESVLQVRCRKKEFYKAKHATTEGLGEKCGAALAVTHPRASFSSSWGTVLTKTFCWIL